MDEEPVSGEFRRWGMSVAKSAYALGKLSELAPSRLRDLQAYYQDCEKRSYKPDLTDAQRATVLAAFGIFSAAVGLSSSAINPRPNVGVAIGISSLVVDKGFNSTPEKQKEFAYYLGQIVNTFRHGPKVETEARIRGYTLMQLNYCRQREGVLPLDDAEQAMTWLEEHVEKNSEVWMFWKEERKRGLPFLKSFPRFAILPKPDDIQKEIEELYDTWRKDN